MVDIKYDDKIISIRYKYDEYFKMGDGGWVNFISVGPGHTISTSLKWLSSGKLSAKNQQLQYSAAIRCCN